MLLMALWRAFKALVIMLATLVRIGSDIIRKLFSLVGDMFFTLVKIVSDLLDNINDSFSKEEGDSSDKPPVEEENDDNTLKSIF